LSGPFKPKLPQYPALTVALFSMRLSVARKKLKRKTVQNDSSITRWITNPLSLVIIITFSGLLLAGKLWGDYRTELSSSDEFRVGPEHLSLNEPPIWLSRQSVKDCAGRFHWEDQHLLNSNLAKDLADYLQKQSWVQQVQVRKTPDKIYATVTYRIPVGIVQISNQRLIPVDGRGIVLDGGDVTKNQVSNYLRIAVANLRQEIPATGSLWPDDRVVEATKIASLVVSSKESLQIDGIYAVPNSKGYPQEYRFWTTDRDEILWGSAIGKETGREAKVETKLRTLAQLTPENRKKIPGYRKGGGNVFDLRGGSIQTAAKPAMTTMLNQY